MKQSILFILVFLLSSSLLRAQDERPVVRPIQYYVGLQPSLSVEPFDEFRSAVNINTVPFSLEYAFSRHMGIRLEPVLILQFRPEVEDVVTTIGADIVVPYYFSKKNTEEGHRGFYIAPLAGFANQQQNNYITVTLAGQAGYAFIFQNVLSISVGAIAGTRLQIDPESSFTRILPRTGGRIALGFWF